MRMWNIDPATMCNKHLFGEHLETHMFVGSINKGLSMRGYIENSLLDCSTLRQRHDELVLEILARGHNHKSPLPEFEPLLWMGPPIDVEWSKAEIARRCPACKARQDALK